MKSEQRDRELPFRKSGKFRGCFPKLWRPVAPNDVKHERQDQENLDAQGNFCM